MSTSPREVLAEADRLIKQSARAAAIAAGMDVSGNREMHLGGRTLYAHPGYPDDLELLDVIRRALAAASQEYAAQAAELEAKVEVTR